MTFEDRFAELWTDYLEGDLDDEGLEEFQKLLATDESFVEHAADLLQTHRLLGLVVADAPSQREAFVRETLAQLPESQSEFVSQVMSQVGSMSNPLRQREFESQSDHPTLTHRNYTNGAWIVTALILVAITLFSFWPKGKVSVAINGSHPLVEEGEVRLASSAHAKFFGELAPPVGAALLLQREYVLMSGLIEIWFPTGASAILEGPAVFRVSSNESLALDVGRCSVHAPEGAEGFQVDTPGSRVVDRGTRFSVNVSETSETEVQVVEGAADVYNVQRVDDSFNAGDIVANKTDVNGKAERLIDGDAKRFVTAGTFATENVPFRESAYRSQLPDRVVSYETTSGPDGGAENLTSVTVQRGGKVLQLSVDALIPARLTGFKSNAARSYLCGGATIPSPRMESLFDNSLVTGVINPDGSVEPLSTDPVLEGEAGTPGMAIRFEQPIVNGPGADLLIFDLQGFGNPPDGDAFHVSPLTFRDGLKSHTIRKFDLTMESPEAKVLTNFHVHFFKEKAGSLAELDTLQVTSHQQSIQFRGLAVGIDLSELGYASGDIVEGLFIQDALDDGHYIDPVFIAGLPEVKE